ncbi:MAG: DegV family protein [Clostridia bacterium]|nr:DegV family protein [Clostridia bacterium]
MGYVIVTDSVLDLEEDFLFQNGICTVPLQFTVEGWDTVEDDFGRTVSFSSFYQQLRQGKNITTAPAHQSAFTSVFEGILKSNRDVVYLGLSSALSGNYQIACIAAEELKTRYYNQVYCVDTLAASGGQALIVSEAAKRKAEGLTSEQLVEWAAEYRSRISHCFMVDDLQYLERNGDLEKKTSLFGSRGSTCQLLHLDTSGKLALDKKVRGRKKALELLQKQAVAQLPKGGTAYISHADCREDAEELAKNLLHNAGLKHVEYIMLNEVIGAHAGPGAIGVFFCREQNNVSI